MLQIVFLVIIISIANHFIKFKPKERLIDKLIKEGKSYKEIEEILIKEKEVSQLRELYNLKNEYNESKS